MCSNATSGTQYGTCVPELRYMHHRPTLLLWSKLASLQHLAGN
jgi:hypothetical protein